MATGSRYKKGHYGRAAGNRISLFLRTPIISREDAHLSPAAPACLPNISDLCPRLLARNWIAFLTRFLKRQSGGSGSTEQESTQNHTHGVKGDSAPHVAKIRKACRLGEDLSHHKEDSYKADDQKEDTGQSQYFFHQYLQNHSTKIQLPFARDFSISGYEPNAFINR